MHPHDHAMLVERPAGDAAPIVAAGTTSVGLDVRRSVSLQTLTRIVVEQVDCNV
jgi:hypothetical protein